MKKLTVAICLTILLSASVAHAAYNLVGFKHSDYVSASITVGMQGEQLSIFVENTSSAKVATLTGLLFNVPAGLELELDDVVYSNPPTGEHDDPFWGYGKAVKRDLGGEPTKWYSDDVSHVLSAGDKGFKDGFPHFGIKAGDNARFLFDVVSGTLSETLDPFLARFKEIKYPDMVGSDSTVATPTPIPGAAWLFGTGLLGLVGLRRRFS